MQSNKFKGIIIYLVIILLLIFGLVWVLNLAGSSAAQGAPTYSDVIAEFDNLNVSEFKLDLGSGKLVYITKDSDEVKTYSVPNVSIFINDINTGYGEDGHIAYYRQRYNEVNEKPLIYSSKCAGASCRARNANSNPYEREKQTLLSSIPFKMPLKRPSR